MKTKCDNCERVTDIDNIIQLENVPMLLTRIDPGGIVPAGECRECGALCYPFTERRRVQRHGEVPADVSTKK